MSEEIINWVVGFLNYQLQRERFMAVMGWSSPEETLILVP